MSSSWATLLRWRKWQERYMSKMVKREKICRGCILRSIIGHPFSTAKQSVPACNRSRRRVQRRVMTHSTRETSTRITSRLHRPRKLCLQRLRRRIHLRLRHSSVLWWPQNVWCRRNRRVRKMVALGASGSTLLCPALKASIEVSHKKLTLSRSWRINLC